MKNTSIVALFVAAGMVLVGTSTAEHLPSHANRLRSVSDVEPRQSERDLKHSSNSADEDEEIAALVAAFLETKSDGRKEEGSPRSAEEISALTSSVKTVFSIEDIAKILPHRYPFLLVDKIVEYEMGKRAVGIKSVTLNEPHFTGHFPDRPIMPGVLQIEALAQLAGIVSLQMEGAEPGAVFFFAGVDGVKWKKPVVPGDTLVMEVEIKKFNKRFGIATATGRAYVDGEMAVELDEM